MAVEADFPARMCTMGYELVVAVGTAAVGAGVETGVGVGVAKGVGLEVGLGVAVGDGDEPNFIGRSNTSLAKLPRPPSAIVASVRPPANTANITRLPKVAATLSTILSYCW
jgi:hypothetical protein